MTLARVCMIPASFDQWRRFLHPVEQDQNAIELSEQMSLSRQQRIRTEMEQIENNEDGGRKNSESQRMRGMCGQEYSEVVDSCWTALLVSLAYSPLFFFFFYPLLVL
jgi:hypothetical protein